jgi:hypothetical protein
MSSTDVYVVRDEDGSWNFLHYPEGGSLYENAKNNREAGIKNQVYKSGREGEEEWTPVSEAVADITIDPASGNIIVDGPDWLTSQIVNSESFKKNYSENTALLGLVNLFRQDPNSTITNQTTGDPIKVSDALKTYQESATNFGQTFAPILDYKNRVAQQYGASFSDANVAVANTFYNKEDYNKSGAVYIPDWAMDKYNWSSVSSWDAENKTVSAQDFFENIYKQDFGDDTASKLQEEALNQMKKFLDYNTYDPSDEKEAKTRQEKIGTKEYADELARTIQMNNLVSQNRPETTALYDAAIFCTSTVHSFFNAAVNAGYNVTAAITQTFETIADWGLDALGVEEDHRDGLGYLMLANPAYLAAAITGEVLGAVRNGANPGEVFQNLQNDAIAIGKGKLGDQFDKYNEAMNASFQEFEAKMQGVSGAAAVGEMAGNLIWKIAENVVLLNTVGGFIEKAITAASTGSGIAAFMGTCMSAQSVGRIFKVLGFSANIAVQGLMETLIDEKQVLNKAFASGEMTPELTQRIASNIWWNAIGEGAMRGMDGVLNKTTGGRMVQMASGKAVARVGLIKDTILSKIAKTLNGFGDGADIANVVAKEGGRSVEAFNIAAGKDAVNVLRKAILKNPITGSASEDFDALIKDMKKTLYPGKTLSTEETEALSKQVADAMDQATGKVTSDMSLSERVEANFNRYRTLQGARANLENQIDAISKGVSMKQTEIQNTIDADGTFTRFKNAESDLATTEAKLVENGSNLTIRESGSLLSKEASEKISLKSQIGHYDWQIKNASEIGLENDPTRLAKIKAFKEAAEEKIAAYDAMYGAEWAQATDRAMEAYGRYNKALTDYMIANGYVDRDYVDLVQRLRKQGYGEDGSLYVPTARLFSDEDIETGVKRFVDDNFSSKVALFRSRKTIGDDPLMLEPGDLESSFVDPTMVLFTKTRAAATVAQAQDLGRAMQSVNMVARQLKGLSRDGFSDYEISLVEKGMNNLKNEINSIVSPNGKGFADIIRKEFNETDILKGAFDQKKLFEKTQAAKNSAEKAGKEYRAVIRHNLNASTQRGIISKSSGDELSGLLANAPEGLDVPSFDIMSLNAKTFDAWKNSLPDYLQEKIVKDLGGKTFNVTNLKKYVRSSNDYIRDLQSTFINKNQAAFKNTKAYREFTYTKLEAEFEATGKTTLSAPREKYLKALEAQSKAEAEFEGAPKWNAAKAETLGNEFNEGVVTLRKNIVKQMADRLSKESSVFNKVVDDVLKESNGVFGEGEEALEAAREYVVLGQLHLANNGSKFAAPLNESIGNTKSTILKAAEKTGGKEQAAKYGRDLANAIGDGLKADIDSAYADMVNMLKVGGGDGAIDMKTYWNDIQKEMNQIEGRGLKADPNGSRFPQANPRKIIQLVGPDGKLAYYEADPMMAFAANASIDFNKTTADGLAKTILGINAQTSQLFRWGTTGIDKASYINQWFRDPMDAIFMGAAKPFTNLRTGSLKSFAASVGSDSIPFGQRVFGKAVTDTFTDEFIEATYETTQKGLVEQYGQEWWDAFAANVTKDVAPEQAEAALKRATVEFSAGTLGADSIPGLGGMTEAQYYRVGGSKGGIKDETFKRSSGGEDVTAREMYREQMNLAKGKEGLGVSDGDLKQWQKASSKMQEKIDNLFEDTSRGNWRESFARRSVYASQYRIAIESGMTMQEARIWATRFALDATTDFGRTFAYANRFIKSVPYLGAAINGHKSFFRLLELDPAGVATRFTYGMILPYMTLLTESLTDPKNREIYETIREYEKQDSVFLVYKGSKVQIPVPQQLGKFLAPFRHLVEKAAKAQDASWRDLVASDILGVFPLDMSGFVNLDANDILMDDETTGLGSRIGRGFEKMFSGLMPPSVKAAYMIMNKRDPYTGRDIDTSYVYLDENGEEQIMDKTKSEIAKGFSEFSKKFGWNLSASAASKVLQSLFGRSTISVLENAGKLFSKDVKGYAEAMADQIVSPVDGGTDYNEAKSNWNNAITVAYQKREELINDDGLQKALAVIRDTTWDEKDSEKRQNAMQVYRNKIDEYSKFVLDIANNMAQKYPEQYTDTRVAQIVSLLTFPTGINYNDTDYSRELQQDSYYDSRNHAINTMLEMGFPLETPGNSILGHGYYDKYGEYQFKVNTPYEIQMIQSAKFGTTDQFQSMIKATLKKADIKTSDMWEGYYAAKAKGKAVLKKYESAWNTKVVTALYPIISKYGAKSVLNDSATRDLLENYLLVDNPYKKKQYMYQIFGGNE